MAATPMPITLPTAGAAGYAEMPGTQRAAALLRNTDRSIAEICFDVGLSSLGSFTTSFKRMFGATPTEYRAQFPPAVARVVVPSCVVRAYGRPQHRTFREDKAPDRE